MPFKGFVSSSVLTPTVSLKTLLTMSIVKDAVFWLGNKARSPFRSSFLCSSGSCKIIWLTPTCSRDIPESKSVTSACIASKNQVLMASKSPEGGGGL